MKLDICQKIRVIARYVFFLTNFLNLDLLAMHIFPSISSHFLFLRLFTNTVISSFCFVSVIFLCVLSLAYSLYHITLQRNIWHIFSMFVLKNLFSLIFAFFDKSNGIWWFIYRDVLFYFYLWIRAFISGSFSLNSLISSSILSLCLYRT